VCRSRGNGMSKRCRSVEARCRSGGLPGFASRKACRNRRSEAPERVEVDVEGMSKPRNFVTRARTYWYAFQFRQDGTRWADLPAPATPAMEVQSCPLKGDWTCRTGLGNRTGPEARPCRSPKGLGWTGPEGVELSSRPAEPREAGSTGPLGSGGAFGCFRIDHLPSSAI
jgi:hypothetical protein